MTHRPNQQAIRTTDRRIDRVRRKLHFQSLSSQTLMHMSSKEATWLLTKRIKCIFLSIKGYAPESGLSGAGYNVRKTWKSKNDWSDFSWILSDSVLRSWTSLYPFSYKGLSHLQHDPHQQAFFGLMSKEKRLLCKIHPLRTWQFDLYSYLHKCSNWSMEVQLPALVGYCDRPTD